MSTTGAMHPAGYVALGNDLVAAVLRLDPATVAVFLDFYQHWDAATRGGRTGDAVRYTHAMCRTRVGRTRFYQALSALQHGGFVCVVAAGRNGSPNAYRPSDAWRAGGLTAHETVPPHGPSVSPNDTATLRTVPRGGQSVPSGGTSYKTIQKNHTQPAPLKSPPTGKARAGDGWGGTGDGCDNWKGKPWT